MSIWLVVQFFLQVYPFKNYHNILSFPFWSVTFSFVSVIVVMSILRFFSSYVTLFLCGKTVGVPDYKDQSHFTSFCCFCWFDLFLGFWLSKFYLFSNYYRVAFFTKLEGGTWSSSYPHISMRHPEKHSLGVRFTEIFWSLRKYPSNANAAYFISIPLFISVVCDMSVSQHLKCVIDISNIMFQCSMEFIVLWVGTVKTVV